MLLGLLIGHMKIMVVQMFFTNFWPMLMEGKGRMGVYICVGQIPHLKLNLMILIRHILYKILQQMDMDISAICIFH
jgi:hypothetical protein